MSYYIIGLLLSLMSWACSDDVETGREEIPVETDGGYLFAHMTNANYGKLYYAASRDAVSLHVHPCICVSMSQIALFVSIVPD